MEKGHKNIILGIVYSLFLFIVFGEYLGMLTSTIVDILFPQDGNIISFIPSTIGMIISIIISILLVYLVIHFITISKINQFLKPDKIKIVSAVVLNLLVLIPVYLVDFGIIRLPLIISRILTFNSIIFSGAFEFMELLFPVVMYYIIVCLLIKMMSGGKEEVNTP